MAEAAEGAVIATERLLLRALAERDEDDFVRIAGRPELAEDMASLPHPFTADNFRERLARTRLGRSDGGDVGFAVSLRAGDGPLVGYVGLHRLEPRHGVGELTFFIDPDRHGRGYAREACAAALAHGFEKLTLNRVQAFAWAGNVRSAGVLTALGMRQEGRMRERGFRRGAFEDVLVWAMTASDRVGG